MGLAVRAITLPHANAARHQRYVARVRARIRGMTPAQLWRKAYVLGYQACWESWRKRVRRGEVVILKERRRFDVEAA